MPMICTKPLMVKGFNLLLFSVSLKDKRATNWEIIKIGVIKLLTIVPLLSEAVKVLKQCSTV